MTADQEKLIQFLKEPLMNGSIIAHPDDNKSSLYSECLELEKAGMLISSRSKNRGYAVFRFYQ